MKYRQRFLLLMSVMALTALALPVPLFGQSVGDTQLTKQTTLTIRGGASLATWGGSGVDQLGDEAAVESRTGFNVGASVAFPLSDRFGLQLGGTYVQKGARFGFGPDPDYFGFDLGSLQVETNVDYIELSALGKASVPFGSPPSRTSVYVLAGPAVAFKANCKVRAFGISAGCDEAEEEQFKTIDFGVAGGIGAEMAIAEKLTVSLDLLYTLGLQSINHSGEGSDASDDFDDDFDEVKNRAFTIQVGLGFPFGR